MFLDLYRLAISKIAIQLVPTVPRLIIDLEE